METRMPENKMAQNPNDSNVRDPGWPTFDHAFDHDRLTFLSFNNLLGQQDIVSIGPHRADRGEMPLILCFSPLAYTKFTAIGDLVYNWVIIACT